MSVRTALIYSHKFNDFSYGESHPFKVQRFRLAYELIKAYSLDTLENAVISESDKISEEDILSFHDSKYIERMKEFSSSPDPRADFLYGLGDAEYPVFP